MYVFVIDVTRKIYLIMDLGKVKSEQMLTCFFLSNHSFGYVNFGHWLFLKVDVSLNITMHWTNIFVLMILLYYQFSP